MPSSCSPPARPAATAETWSARGRFRREGWRFCRLTPGALAAVVAVLALYTVASVVMLSSSVTRRYNAVRGPSRPGDGSGDEGGPPSSSRSNGNGSSNDDGADDGGSFSACLLVMDDNHFLSEWIAYHHHAVNLRTLIIATDPRSLTSPSNILSRWRPYMDDVTEWNDDNDYMTVDEFESAQDAVRRTFSHLTPELVLHRARQRLFFSKCLAELQRRQRHEAAEAAAGKGRAGSHHRRPQWTMLIDTDEFLTLNYDLISKRNNHTGMAARPMDRPGAVAQFIHDHAGRGDVVTTDNGGGSGRNTDDDVPLQMLQSSPCLQIPRIRFIAIDRDGGDNDGSNVTRAHPDADTVPSSLSLLLPPSLSANNFLTLRYHVHAAPSDHRRNKVSKAVLDLSRIPPEALNDVDSVHLPVRRYCHQRRLHTRKSQSFLTINHYMGSYEQYTYRENDARHGLMDALASGDGGNSSMGVGGGGNNQIRNPEIFRQNQQISNPQTDDAIQPWVAGFLRARPPGEGESLLEGVGRLDPKSWRTHRHGGDNVDQCAILFFGLPRAFQSMVLPSVVRNVLVPNARHGCDVYVHFYRQTEEAPGRFNRGGTVDPDEIFLLEEAVRAVAEQHGPKPEKQRTSPTGRGGAVGPRRPIVAFTHDTPEQFGERRGELVSRYRDTVGPDGRPKYFPWAAKTYTNSSIENMVRQWHLIECAFKLMQVTAAQNGISYSRVGMFRSDALFVTPIDIASIDDLGNVMDTKNHYFVTAPFALFPVNDRAVYGPFDAVKIWATKRFEYIEERAAAGPDPGFTMHSERFLGGSVFPAMADLGYELAINPDICFLRARADESALVSDCFVGGTTRNLKPAKIAASVERIVGRNCTPFKMGHKWNFVGCGEGREYRGGKNVG